MEYFPFVNPCEVLKDDKLIKGYLCFTTSLCVIHGSVHERFWCFHHL